MRPGRKTLPGRQRSGGADYILLVFLLTRNENGNGGTGMNELLVSLKLEMRMKLVWGHKIGNHY